MWFFLFMYMYLYFKDSNPQTVRHGDLVRCENFYGWVSGRFKGVFSTLKTFQGNSRGFQGFPALSGAFQERFEGFQRVVRMVHGMSRGIWGASRVVQSSSRRFQGISGLSELFSRYTNLCPYFLRHPIRENSTFVISKVDLYRGSAIMYSVRSAPL